VLHDVFEPQESKPGRVPGVGAVSVTVGVGVGGFEGGTGEEGGLAVWNSVGGDVGGGDDIESGGDGVVGDAIVDVDDSSIEDVDDATDDGVEETSVGGGTGTTFTLGHHVQPSPQVSAVSASPQAD
jgi:hypothetical protein